MKREHELDFATISRHMYYDSSGPGDLEVCYVLNSWEPAQTSYIVGFKKTDDEEYPFVFETKNSIYKVHALYELEYWPHILEELEAYLHSKEKGKPGPRKMLYDVKYDK